MRDNISCIAIKLIIMSILGNGKSSFGQALLISQKFVHRRMPVGFLLIGTMLDI